MDLYSIRFDTQEEDSFLHGHLDIASVSPCPRIRVTRDLDLVIGIGHSNELTKGVFVSYGGYPTTLLTFHSRNTVRHGRDEYLQVVDIC